MLGPVRQLSVDDASQRDVAERSATLPALEAGLGDRPFRPSGGVELRQGREPADTGDAMSSLAARVGVQEMVGENGGVRVVEPERSQTR
jgi:hypothetical protein